MNDEKWQAFFFWKKINYFVEILAKIFTSDVTGRISVMARKAIFQKIKQI